VDLTPPPEVVKFRNSGGSSTGEDLGASGGAGGGTAADTGGSRGSGGAIGAGGTTGAGGVTTSPGAGGGAGNADANLDVTLGSGGTVNSGGSVSQGGSITTGGSTGTGGQRTDVPPGTGGSSPDVPNGSGGAVGSGGITSAGGMTAAGGAIGTGGTKAGTGGTTAYSCANAIVPASGVVTDFSDWNATTARWGSGALTGNIYQYNGGSATMNAAKVEGTPVGLHLSGSVPSGSYGGGGVTFLSCVTVASFTKVQFDVYGSGANCSIELQLQTFDQRPVDQTPPGGCKADGGSGCFNFPVKSMIVDLSTAVAASAPKTVSATLASFTNWSTTLAGQIVGMQWQFTGNGCKIDATFTNIKFVP
jgi:hypothetical protein